MDFEEALEIAIRGRRKVRFWVECGGARARLATLDMTHDGEPIAILPHRSGAHLTMHQSGEIDASDGHGYREKSSWLTRESEVRQAVEPFLVDLRADFQLCTLELDMSSWLDASPGSIVLNFDNIVESISTMTGHLVTPRLIQQQDLDLGPFFFAPETGEIVCLLSPEGEALAIPMDGEAQEALRHKWPVIGPATKLLDGLVERSEALVASGKVREPKAARAWEDVRAAFESRISNVDFTRMRFVDHVRGQVHSLNADGSTDVRNL